MRRTTGSASGWPAGQLGRAQADSLARRLAHIPLSAIFSSPLERALETAQPLAQSCDLSITVRDGLGEISYGDWTGRSLKELQQDELWPIIQVHPSGVRFPGGESIHQVQSRMVAQLDAIRDAYPGQTVAVVSHADPIKAAVAYYAGLPLDLFQRLTISPASVTAFSFTRMGARLICANHTEDLPSFKIEKEDKNEEQ
jgi:probable phosphomutase (TIGR03848 family)